MLLTVLDRQNSNRGEPLPHHQPAEHPDALPDKMCSVTDPVFNRFECFTGRFKVKSKDEGRGPAARRFQTERARMN